MNFGGSPLSNKFRNEKMSASEQSLFVSEHGVDQCAWNVVFLPN
jgi:hypothetical protein